MIPALVLDSGETLLDSSAIFDYLDHVGPSRTLTPASDP
jgi:glutathione S-transferase